NLTRLLLLPLLARFSLMGQLHALKIHFERQPRQVRAVGNSEQNFGNSADRFPHQALVPLWISDVLRHTHLGNGVANVVVQEGEFQSSSDRSLASPFDDHRHQGGNDNHFHYSSGRCAYIPRSVSLPPHSIQRDPNERNYNAYHGCGDKRLEERRRSKSKHILTLLVVVRQLMLIGFHDDPRVTECVYGLMLPPLPFTFANLAGGVSWRLPAQAVPYSLYKDMAPRRAL